MASGILGKAAKKIESQNRRLANIRREKKEELRTVVQYGSTLSGAAGAALVDSKWGDGEEPAELIGLPTNAVVAAGGMAAAMLMPRNMPGRDVIGFASLGMASGALYRFTFDKLEEREARKAAEAAASD